MSYVVGGCPVPCRMLSSVPGLGLLDASAPSRCDDGTCLQTWLYVPGWGAGDGQQGSALRTIHQLY